MIQGRTGHIVCLLVLVWVKLFEFSVRETGQNTALEVVIYGLMHLTNGV